MMNDIKDAPYIRDAELFGMDDGPEIEWKCPVCGADCPERFFVNIKTDEVIGCDECMGEVDAYEWTLDTMEDEDHE